MVYGYSIGNKGYIMNGQIVHKPEQMPNKPGRVLNDTDALVLARRGLVRYLLHEAEEFYSCQRNTKMEHSITKSTE